MQQEITYETARRHVERKLGFLVHLSVYVVVNSGLMLFNFLHQPNLLWAFAPLLGWGIGLLFHGLAIFLRAPGAAWKQRMIDKELLMRHEKVWSRIPSSRPSPRGRE